MIGALKVKKTETNKATQLEEGWLRISFWKGGKFGCLENLDIFINSKITNKKKKKKDNK